MSSSPIFQVAPEVFERFPHYVVGCVAAFNIDQRGASQKVDELVENAAFRARVTYQDADLKSVPPFAAWREAFSSAGWSPSRFPASSEAIHRRIQRGAEMPRINPIVDLANSAVLYYAVPVGVHDIHTFGTDALEVRWADSSDEFVGMDGSSTSPDAPEIVYAVGSDIRTRRWVWRQGKNGRISSSARDILFPIDGFVGSTYDGVVAAQNYLAQVAREELNARVVTGLISRENPAFLTD